MGTAIKHPVPDGVKPSFVIFGIRALWHSALSVRVPWCQKLQMTPKPGLTGTGRQRVKDSVTVTSPRSTPQNCVQKSSKLLLRKLMYISHALFDPHIIFIWKSQNLNTCLHDVHQTMGSTMPVAPDQLITDTVDKVELVQRKCTKPISNAWILVTFSC